MKRVRKTGGLHLANPILGRDPRITPITMLSIDRTTKNINVSVKKDFTLENNQLIVDLRKGRSETQRTLPDFIELFPTKPSEKPKQLEPEDIQLGTINYGRNWNKYNESSMKEKRMSLQFLTELLDGIDLQEPKKRGRKSLSVKEKLICLFIQCYNGLSSRRVISDIMTAKEANLISKSVHFNTITNYLKDPVITGILRKLINITTFPVRGLDSVMAVDATGMSCYMYERWSDVRNAGTTKRKMFSKLSVMSGTTTNIIFSASVGGGHEHDINFFERLLVEAYKISDIDVVCADKGYVSRENYRLAQELGMIPLIPFKKNNIKNSKGVRLWRLMYEAFHYRKAEYMAIYHQRSKVECVFAQIKRKFGATIKSKTPVSQENELLVRCLCHNLSILSQVAFDLNISIDFCAEEITAHMKS